MFGVWGISVIAAASIIMSCISFCLSTGSQASS